MTPWLWFWHLDQLLPDIGLNLSENAGHDVSHSLIKHKRQIDTFLSTCTTIDPICAFPSAKFYHNLHSEGFAKQSFICKYGITFDIYHGDPPRVLQGQVSLAPGDPLKANSGLEAFPAVEKALEESVQSDVCLKTFTVDGMKLNINSFQLYIERFWTSLQAGPLIFERMHVTAPRLTD